MSKYIHVPADEIVGSDRIREGKKLLAIKLETACNPRKIHIRVGSITRCYDAGDEVEIQR